MKSEIPIDSEGKVGERVREEERGRGREEGRGNEEKTHGMCGIILIGKSK